MVESAGVDENRCFPNHVEAHVFADAMGFTLLWEGTRAFELRESKPHIECKCKCRKGIKRVILYPCGYPHAATAEASYADLLLRLAK